MRTTLTLDDDVVLAAKSLADQQRRTLGEVVSELARQALYRPAAVGERNGLPLLPAVDDRRPVTLAMVNTFRDESP